MKEAEPAAAAPSAEESRFPCPGCGAALHWDPDSGGLRCPFCGAGRKVESDPDATIEERALDEALLAAKHDREDPRRVRRVDCRSCGAVVEVPPTEKAGRCAWCGSSRIIEEEESSPRIVPQAVLPFAVDADDAAARFRKWIRSLWFRPNALRDRSTMADLRGVLVPFWTFDASASSEWTALAGYHYYVAVQVGKQTVMQQRTRWVPAAGRRRDMHDDVLVCAGRGLNGKLLHRILPFPLQSLRPYRPEYLAGWAAEAYAIDAREGWSTAEKRIREEQRARCAGDVPGDTHSGLSVDTVLTGRTYKHVLLPVWVASYRFRDRTWTFLVNGATGEIHGDAPFSWIKITLFVLAILAVLAGIALAVEAS